MVDFNLENIIMKKILFVVSILFGQICFWPQTNTSIDTSNYYSYFSPKDLKGHKLTTDWLRLDDVVPIMLEELKNAGYDWLYDRTIYRLENGQHINISAYSRKNNIGFLYIEGHNMFPSKSDRDILFQKDNSKVRFVECEETSSGEPEISYKN